MNGPEYLDFLENMRAARASGVRRREAMEVMMLFHWLGQQPFACVGDLAAHGELTSQRVSHLLSVMSDRGYVIACSLGSGQSRQRRYVLSLAGAIFMTRFGLTPGWQNTREGMERLTWSIPLLEVAYSLAPRLWRSSAAMALQYHPCPGACANREPTMDDRAVMHRFTWVRSRHKVGAVAEYVNPSGEEVAVPLLWHGSQHGPNRIGDATLASLFRGIVPPEGPDDGEAPVSPPGAVIICADAFAALQVSRQFAPDVPKAVVTTAWEVVETLSPVPPRGRIRMIDKPADRVGVPDGIGGWLARTSHGAALEGVEASRVFSWVEAWPGSLISHVVREPGCLTERRARPWIAWSSTTWLGSWTEASTWGRRG